ncbi:non-specific serine/threonine protein kinase [Theileria orientalis]|uniref:Non-specific serine/threonine protein kinase n=1 Tax=Theileria orientalis TaxID=68886 RepID=A0A976QTQ5_THEOR|nr:non-specific serine/threonine protein kinase [Theileria orientalis]
MAFNKCKQWNGEFKDIYGMDIEYVKSSEFEKLKDLVTVWEVIRLISKSDINIDDSFEFLSSCKLINGHIGREFDECVEKGLAKANLLFSELVHISSILKQYYMPSVKCNATLVNNNNSNISTNNNATVNTTNNIIKENDLNHITKNPRLFKINRPLRNNVSRTTVSTSNSSKDDKEENGSRCKIKFCNTYKDSNVKISGYGNNDYMYNTSLKYIKRNVPCVIINNYIILHLINEGSVGKVYLAIDYKKNVYAVKIITKSDDYHTFNKIKDELLIASRMKHDNIVETYSILETNSKLLIFMEYCAGGDLITYIRRNGSISEQVVKKMFKMLLRSIKYLHELNVYHRDIKPENILLKPVSRVNGNGSMNGGSNMVVMNNSSKNDPTSINVCNIGGNIIGMNKILTNYVLKLGDFGASVRAKNDTRLYETVGTMSYAAPEVLEGTSGYYGEKADIWSLGVVLFAMLYGQLPYTTQEESVEGILKQIMGRKLTFPRYKTSSEVKQLISMMLEINPQNRIGLKQVYSHEWVTGKRMEIDHIKVLDLKKESMEKEINSTLNIIVDEII